VKLLVNFGDGKSIEVEGANYDEVGWALSHARALLGI
jgi:hypothetical protein